ncbi:transcriptional regulator, LacI family [Proteiniborus ethanoligenes]|uniref:Transcriptional regulator, LacI family n=1 Tax=Proteiniborus ethanoligenes TaxID=415015 RepID=A0A1H3LB07_9FIRM|nr:LacI family DNA-binding transcriptional regulator [Proteiniborus ethanoligenes]TAH63929.1 MAG: LacI family transcriptional regulator [Gottschalkiaceae bacterium]SDY61098.1 transcriptional regulator, LacI family [Proteiniborus ethanoligenes]
MTATIKDVAKMAGVSISTVSRVINNSKPVSPEIRQKVLEVINEIGYKPNEVARTLVTKKSFLIGVIVTDLGDTYIAQLVRGIEEVGKMYDYDILLCSTYGDKAAEIKYMQILSRKQAEGIILISDSLNKEIDNQIKDFKMPFVYLNRYFSNEDFPTVTIDSLEATYEMTNYLISLGHENIAYVSSSEEENSLEMIKLEGYKKAISENEGYEEKIYYAKGRNIDDGYEICKDIISSNDEITAIFCSHDELSIGVLSYLHDNNIKVPDQMSVAGYGDIKTASIFRPRLTTIKEPFYDIGAVAIRRIIKEIKKEKVDKDTIILPFQIQKRESCAKIL